MEQSTTRQPHRLVLENRKKSMISGVQDVQSFHEQEILLLTEEGKLQIKGEGLHVKRLSVLLTVHLSCPEDVVLQLQALRIHMHAFFLLFQCNRISIHVPSKNITHQISYFLPLFINIARAQFHGFFNFIFLPYFYDSSLMCSCSFCCFYSITIIYCIQ